MKDILTQVGRRDGLTVPDGYFDDFADRLNAALPPREWERATGRELPRSIWQRVRPYVYMAAMFMGVWCMMKTFDLMRPSQPMSFDSNPVLAAAVGNDTFVSDYLLTEGDLSQYQLLDDLYEAGFTPASYTPAASDDYNMYNM